MTARLPASTTAAAAGTIMTLHMMTMMTILIMKPTVEYAYYWIHPCTLHRYQTATLSYGYTRSLWGTEGSMNTENTDG